MEIWFLILISVAISYILKLIFSFIYPSRKQSLNLPPGPIPYPIIGNLLLFRKSLNDIKSVVQPLHAKYGPIITLRFGSRPVICIADRFLAHQALVKHGAIFADRPPVLSGSNQSQVSTAFYGTKWNLLRRTLAAEILQPSGLKAYAHARKWTMEGLLNRLKLQSESGGSIQVVEYFEFSIFSLILFMCFGDKFEDEKIKEIVDFVKRQLSIFGRFSMVYLTSIWPSVLKFDSKLWDEFLQLGQQGNELLITLIKQRLKLKEDKLRELADDGKFVLSYIDRLLDLYIQEENRKLDDNELFSLCSEFVSAGTHSTTSALQWIMANLVKYPHIQNKLLMEIKGVVEDGEKLVKEEDLAKIPYLRAVVIEGLRKHPLGPFMLPHSVTEDIAFNGYTISKNSVVLITNAEMGLDPEVWEDPITFKPERFLSDENDGKPLNITWDRETKMMPFGVGRRICPGYALGTLHLEYFVANLIWSFEWKAVDGENVDMETMQGDFVVTMKNPLKAILIPRF